MRDCAQSEEKGSEARKSLLTKGVQRATRGKRKVKAEEQKKPFFGRAWRGCKSWPRGTIVHQKWAAYGNSEQIPWHEGEGN